MTRVVVGMSGGVDSSVTAWLLKQQGHEVVGLFMKNWEDDDDDAYCSTRQDLLDAVSVADRIGIEIEAVNFSAEYKDRVFAEFLREYQAGRTPNPDVLCNAEIKFKAFLDHAIGLGADVIATGHYAQVALDAATGQHRLLRAIDDAKDQSYFLHRLTPAQLSRSWFPLGGMHKRDVRALAEKIGLHNAAKRDSTGICFIGERPFREFLNRYLSYAHGDIVTPEGQVVGEHVGLSFYTTGQRQGLGIGGSASGNGEPWFVAGKDLIRNRLIAVQGHDHRLLLSPALIATQASWTGGTMPVPGRYTAKTRYRQVDAGCTLSARADGGFELRFDDPQWAVTAGQSAVLYDGDACLGGGIIDAAMPMPVERVSADAA